MNILVVGATGFIGSALRGALLNGDHQVTATYHRGPSPTWPTKRTTWRRADLAKLDMAGALSLLAGIDAVINCAGVLQDSAWESTLGVHVEGLRALVTACEQLRIRRFIHLSAIGSDRHAPTNFSQSKRDGEAVLAASFLDWVILRPSVVVGTGAFGGSALLRGLAALPLIPVLPDTGKLQIVQREDVIRTVLFFLPQDAPSRVMLDLAGPDALDFSQAVSIYRRWLGWRPARPVSVPPWIGRGLYLLGDLVRGLGWRPPLGSTARREMHFGAVGDASRWRALTGIHPLGLADALSATPASVQERWFARLYLLKPLGFGIFSLFWISTGLISLTAGYDIGVGLMREGGAGVLSGPSVVAGAIADICVGLAIAFRPSARVGLYGAIALTAFYVIAGTLTLPRLWEEPLGPLLKIWPILALNLMLLAILEER